MTSGSGGTSSPAASLEGLDSLKLPEDELPMSSEDENKLVRFPPLALEP